MSTLADNIATRLEKLPPQTNAYRVSDGTEWAGVFIDALADRLLVSVRDAAVPRSLRAQLEATGRPVYLKRLDKDVKEAPVHLCGPQLPLRFPILENGVSYMMDMSAGYSQGIFLDQRDNRARVRGLCHPGMRLLNTFSYTGAFSVCAALAGTTTTTLDLAQPCLTWCRENMELNGIDSSPHFFCKGDTLHWLDRFARQGRTFDAIVLDPPTFSRDEKGRIWRVEKDYGTLVAKAMACLSPGGWLLCTTNCRKLTHAQFRHLVATGAPGAHLSSSPMPFDFNGEDYLKTIWVNA
ncbi:MAG: class I SAM-dependent rRNA methyltransferase [Akkermansia sp.]|nr:class I SAM-dependent rRNA methyltransferase [Akkermansia sp.]